MNFKDILNICWNILCLYLIGASLVIAHDYKKHPEKYVAVEQRPIRDPNPLNYQAYPQWMYDASTIQECRPMQNWMIAFDKWLKPAFWATIILFFISFGYRHREKLSSFLGKLEEANQEGKN